MVLRKYSTLALLAAVIGLAALPSPAEAQQPHAVIERFHDQLLAVMKNAKTLGFEGRRAKLAPAVERTFDLPFMAQFATAAGWDAMQPQQRTAIVDLFRRMTVSSYAARFNDYDGEEFSTLDATETPNKDVVVRARLKAASEDVTIDYLMRATDNGWRVVDVYFMRISELATRRSEYGSVIRREGVTALVASLERKVKEIENGTPK
ncbi:MAG: ABC transporter substrate-binding protein [Alphaproteobacteria bacterium]